MLAVRGLTSDRRVMYDKIAGNQFKNKLFALLSF